METGRTMSYVFFNTMPWMYVLLLLLLLLLLLFFDCSLLKYR